MFTDDFENIKIPDRVPMEALPYEARRILSLLRPGQKNSMMVKEICRLTGYRDEFIRVMGRRLLMEFGWPIGTSNDLDTPGLYLMQSEDERKRTFRNLYGRARQIADRAYVVNEIRLIDPKEWEVL